MKIIMYKQNIKILIPTNCISIFTYAPVHLQYHLFKLQFEVKITHICNQLLSTSSVVSDSISEF